MLLKLATDQHNLDPPAACKRNQIQLQLTETLKELATTLQRESWIQVHSWPGCHCVDQGGTQMLRWTRSPCSDNMLSWRRSNTAACHKTKLHKGVPEYVWHLGGGSCGGCGILRPSSVSAQFNRCASERDAFGELARWIKGNFRHIGNQHAYKQVACQHLKRIKRMLYIYGCYWINSYPLPTTSCMEIFLFVRLLSLCHPNVNLIPHTVCNSNQLAKWFSITNTDIIPIEPFGQRDVDVGVRHHLSSWYIWSF